MQGRLAPGDLLVLPGSPGHVLVVLDVVWRGDEPRLLLGEGYMPAQSFHVLQHEGDPWFAVIDDNVRVPSWPKPFSTHEARRFSATP